MKIERFDHFSFTVAEVDRSIAFYARFGYEPIGRRQSRGIISTGEGASTDVDVEIAWLRAVGGGPMLELVRYLGEPTERARPNSRVGAAHLCFAVGDLQDTYEELRRDGVPFLSPPRTDQLGTRWVYLRDPDGNTVELLQDPPSGS
jgi:catechol 2,3-dioxygenase-like lactoylglutathione lyase family enzyme